MKIFSNFDTNLKRKIYEKWKNEFGEHKVLLLTKSSLFRFVRVEIPLFLYFFGLGLLGFFFYKWLGYEGLYFGALPLALMELLFIFPNIKNSIIDYHMDFAIITPEQVIRYNQEGFWKIDTISTNVESIKTITVSKKGLLYSIFNNGDIIFLSEGDENNNGEIMLHYIYKPEIKKNIIIEIMNVV